MLFSFICFAKKRNLENKEHALSVFLLILYICLDVFLLLFEKAHKFCQSTAIGKNSADRVTQWSRKFGGFFLRNIGGMCMRGGAEQ
jgi:hypothetical protein